MVYLPRFLISIYIYIYIYYYHYHYSIIINMSLACMLRTWSPKMVSFCKNMLLCIFLNQASVVLKDQSIICVRKWTMGLLICAVFFVAMLTKSEVACLLTLLHGEGVSPHATNRLGKPYKSSYKMMGCAWCTKCTSNCSVSLQNCPYLQRSPR